MYDTLIAVVLIYGVYDVGEKGLYLAGPIIAAWLWVMLPKNLIISVPGRPTYRTDLLAV